MHLDHLYRRQASLIVCQKLLCRGIPEYCIIYYSASLVTHSQDTNNTCGIKLQHTLGRTEYLALDDVGLTLRLDKDIDHATTGYAYIVMRGTRQLCTTYSRTAKHRVWCLSQPFVDHTCCCVALHNHCVLYAAY